MAESAGVFTVMQEYWKELGVPFSLVVLIAVLLLAAIAAFIWFALRKARLWYWKVNLQVQTLQQIDDRLRKIESGPRHGANEKPAEPAAEKRIKKVKKKQVAPCLKSVGISEDVQAEIRASSGRDKQLCKEMAERRVGNIGRSGKVYTAEELEKQILE